MIKYRLRISFLCLLFLVGLQFFFNHPAAAEPAKVKLTALVQGKNVSVDCLAIVEDLEYIEDHILEPSGDYLVGHVHPGSYVIRVMYTPLDTLELYMSEVEATVSDGQTLELVVPLHSLNEMMGEYANPDPEQGSGLPSGDQGLGENDPEDLGEQPNGSNDSGDPNQPGETSDPWGDEGDEGDYPQNDQPDDSGEQEGDSPEKRRRPVGEVTLQWHITAVALFSETYTHELDSGDAFYPGATRELTADRFSAVFSGSYAWPVLDDRGMYLELGEGIGSVSRSGGGSGFMDSQDMRTVLCLDANLQSVERPMKSTSTGSWSSALRSRKDLHPPSVNISPDGFYQVGIGQFFFIDEVESQFSFRSTVETCGSQETETWSPDSVSTAAVTCELALGFILQDEQVREQLRGEFSNPEGFVATKSISREMDLGDPYLESLDKDRRTSNRVKVNVQFTIKYTRTAPPYEVVIVPPAEFESWLPQAGEDENTAGTEIAIQVELRERGEDSPTNSQKATFRLELLETSQEPGICVNAPSQGSAAVSYDLAFYPDSDLNVSPDGQTVTTQVPAASVDVVLECFDWGAFSRLRVTATTEDGDTIAGYVQDNPGTEELPIPWDENENKVADAWEKEVKVLSEGFAPDWCKSWKPENQAGEGDGISFFEKYRGLVLLDETGEKVHRRLNPVQKQLFIYDPDNLLKEIAENPVTEPYTFDKISGLEICLVDEELWTGSGSASQGKRVVNFNYDTGHKVDQHALHIYKATGDQPVMPQPWYNHITSLGVTPHVLAFAFHEGYAFPDGLHFSKMGPPKYTFIVKVNVLAITDTMRQHLKLHLNAQEWFQEIYELKWGPKSRTVSPELRPEIDEAYRQAQQMIQEQANNYIAEHPAEWEAAVNKRIALVLAHELGHSVGVYHHQPELAGNRACVMRLLDFKNDGCPVWEKQPEEVILADLLCQQIYEPWMDQLCTDVLYTRGGKGCFGQIVVCDCEE